MLKKLQSMFRRLLGQVFFYTSPEDKLLLALNKAHTSPSKKSAHDTHQYIAQKRDNASGNANKL